MSARVAVVANVQARAKEVAAQLGITGALHLGARPSARGFMLDALIIHESALPLSQRSRDELLPSLIGRNGKVYELREVT